MGQAASFIDTPSMAFGRCRLCGRRGALGLIRVVIDSTFATEANGGLQWAETYGADHAVVTTLEHDPATKLSTIG